MITVGSILLCLSFSIIVTLYLSWVLSGRRPLTKGVKLIFWGAALILLRMLLPFNFPFTVDVPVTRILPAATDFLYKPRAGMGMNILQIIIILSAIGAVIKFICIRWRSWISYRKFVCYLERDTRRTVPVYEILSANHASDIRVAVVPESISPSITGLIHPILILPQWVLADKGLEYMVKHEIEHYRNHDLWLKALIELVGCLYWWNPFAYFLERKMYLVMELSNDQSVIKDLTASEKIEYSEHLRSAAEKASARQAGTIAFFYSRSDLKIRVQAVIDAAIDSTSHSWIRVCINVGVMAVMVFCGLFFVPEAYNPLPEDLERSTFAISEDNAYLVKTETGYDLYINNKYIISMDDIDESFSKLEIKEKQK